MLGVVSEGVYSYQQYDVCTFKNLATLSSESFPSPAKVIFAVKPTQRAQGGIMNKYGLDRPIKAFLIPDT